MRLCLDDAHKGPGWVAAGALNHHNDATRDSSICLRHCQLASNVLGQVYKLNIIALRLDDLFGPMPSAVRSSFSDRHFNAMG
jgi:hypothetical protein